MGVWLSPLVVIMGMIGVSWLVVLTESPNIERRPPPPAVNASEVASMRRAIEVLERQMAEASSDCTLEADVDFGDSGAEVPVATTDAEACCAACRANSRCAAAVFSRNKAAPHACWIKYSRTQRLAKPGVVACVPPDSSKASSPMCEFRPNEDVGPGWDDRVFEIDSTRERCCAACVADRSCAAAVLSSAKDEPPLACWLKRHDEPRLAKSGVVTCLPNRRGKAQTEAAKKALIGNKKHDEPYALSPSDSIPRISAAELAKRRTAIREAARHCWRAYKARAWGRDSVAPISGRGVSAGFDAAVTLVDSLDTLKLFGLDDEFLEGRKYVAGPEFAAQLRRLGGATSVFETTIRILGGLLGAYTLSLDPIFLDRAKQVGYKIVASINSNGIVPPSFAASLRSGCSSLAHAGTNQLELSYLAHLAGDASLAAKALRFYDTVRDNPRLEPGLYPRCVGGTSGKITLGAEADSFYEYLLKLWLWRERGEPLDDWLWRAYNAAADGLDSVLATRSAGRIFVDNLDWRGGASYSRDPSMEHLTCFVGGWLALGSTRQTDKARADRHLALADEVAATCWKMYDNQPSKIGPERVKQRRLDLSATDTREYILRPEAAETWWYLFRVRTDANPTANFDHYRDWGWQAFQAMDANLRVEFGFASLRDVSNPNPRSHLLDRMESFWIAETLKYLYLLQDDSPNGGILPLDKYVLNTEAHPFAIPTR